MGGRAPVSFDDERVGVLVAEALVILRSKHEDEPNDIGERAVDVPDQISREQVPEVDRRAVRPDDLDSRKKLSRCASRETFKNLEIEELAEYSSKQN